MEIGLFQLENIFNARTQFTFLDLRESSQLNLGLELSKIVALAIPVTSENIEGHLNKIQIAKEYPEVADETNEVIIKLILVILIGVILLVIIGFAVALFLFFGGFI